MNLINSNKLAFFIPTDIKLLSLKEQYDYIADYHRSNPNVPLDVTAIFGPFPEPLVPWDISEEEKIVIYNKEVHKVLIWVTNKIVVNLSRLDYKTLDVLIRIATGMLNKCDIQKEVQISLHDNLVENLRTEHQQIILSELPF